MTLEVITNSPSPKDKPSKFSTEKYEGTCDGFPIIVTEDQDGRMLVCFPHDPDNHGREHPPMILPKGSIYATDDVTIKVIAPLPTLSERELLQEVLRP